MAKPPPPAEFDENPEWTDEDFARARPADEVLPPDVLAALMGRHIAGEEVTLTLDSDVIAKFKSAGDDWNARINAALRVADPFGRPLDNAA